MADIEMLEKAWRALIFGDDPESNGFNRDLHILDVIRTNYNTFRLCNDTFRLWNDTLETRIIRNDGTVYDMTFNTIRRLHIKDLYRCAPITLRYTPENSKNIIAVTFSISTHRIKTRYDMIIGSAIQRDDPILTESASEGWDQYKTKMYLNSYQLNKYMHRAINAFDDMLNVGYSNYTYPVGMGPGDAVCLGEDILTFTKRDVITDKVSDRIDEEFRSIEI